MHPAPGTRLRDLVLVAPLGRGAQGAVWRARSESTGAVVALKVMRLRGGRESERARREARALAQLAHPSLPRCMRTLEDEASGLLGLELELVDGFDLGQPDVALDAHARRMALRHVAVALQHLHDAGVVHRDVKPANIVVARDFAARPENPAGCKLVDLGIAVTTGNPSPLTGLGHPGTVVFMAPEALHPVGFPAAPGRPTLDVFAFGVTGWLLLRGKHPTGLPLDADGDELAHAYLDHVEAEHLFLPPEDVVDPFERVLAACLRLRPEARPQDGRALVALLDDALAAARSGETAAPRAATRTRGSAEPARRLTEPQPAPIATLLAAQPVPVAPAPTVHDGPAARAHAPAVPMAPMAAAAPRPPAGTARPGRRISAREMVLLGALCVATAGVIALMPGMGGAGASRARDAARSAAGDGGDDGPPTSSAGQVPSGSSPSSVSPAPRPARPPSPEPPTRWDAVGESNVRLSTALGCETKVLDGWFRALCRKTPGTTLAITAPAHVGARVEHEAWSSTVLVPLRGPDVTLVFDWQGGVGVRTLRVVGVPVEHRTIQLQGEFSAP